jgi:hypothetical protein
MPLNQQDHGDENWGDLSKGWPSTDQYPYEKWVFANKSNVIPYGSYVLMDSNQPKPYLRVESQELLNKLNERFDIVRKVIVEKYEEALGINPVSYDGIYGSLGRRRV